MKKFVNGIDEKKILAKFSPSKLYAFIKVAPLILISFIGMIIGMKFFPFLILLALITSILAWYKYMQILLPNTP